MKHPGSIPDPAPGAGGDAGNGARAGRRPRRSAHRSLLVVGFALVITVGWFREPLRTWVAGRATLANPAPPPEQVEEMIDAASDREGAILAAWNSGKIIHRQVAMRSAGMRRPLGLPVPPRLEGMVLAGALDGDMNVRESALGLLVERGHPSAFALTAAQLTDPDPQARSFALDLLKRADRRVGTPLVIPLLDEADPLIVTKCLKLLEQWSGEAFGVKLHDTLSVSDPVTGLKVFREGSREKAAAGAIRAKAWWAQHRSEFPPVALPIPAAAMTGLRPVPAGDFSLPDLQGRRVRLADFRGRVVLINFWTTRCAACVAEMPELIALQKKHGRSLAVLGVSLDFVPDSHGHIGGHDAVEDQGHGEAGHDHDERAAVSRARVREKVARTVKVRGINYPILLDEKNEVGGRFNGGELPTTVIVDPWGNVRRRFIGARSLPVFEAMIAEAAVKRSPPTLPAAAPASGPP